MSSLPYLTSSKSSKEFVSKIDDELQGLEDQEVELINKRKLARQILKEIEQKKASLAKDPDRNIKIYGLQRRLKKQLAEIKEKLDKMKSRKDRVSKRAENMRKRGELFEKLHIDAEKGLGEVRLLRKVDQYDPKENKKLKKYKELSVDTKVQINYLKSQEKNRLEEIDKAHRILEMRMKKRGELLVSSLNSTHKNKLSNSLDD